MVFISILNFILSILLVEVKFLRYGILILLEIYNVSKIEINMAIQINGKTRQVIKTDQNKTEEQIRDIALKDPKIEKYILDKKIVKHIYVKNKIINFIVKN